jgi:hypothetical protein
MQRPKTDAPALRRRLPVAFGALVTLAAIGASGCGTARMYAGSEPVAGVATVRMKNRLTWNDRSAVDLLIAAVDGERVSEHAGLLERGLTGDDGATSVGVLAGEHRFRVHAREKLAPRLTRELCFAVEPGVEYALETRASERQPPIEVFAYRADTRAEVGLSWLGPPDCAAFGVDPRRWAIADWRVEERWHWIRFEPLARAGGEGREALRLEWSEADRWSFPVTAAWAHGIDVRRALETEYANFEWRVESSGDALGVYTWSGDRLGDRERVHGLLVLRVRDGRAATLRYQAHDAELLQRELAAWREFGVEGTWHQAWAEALP